MNHNNGCFPVTSLKTQGSYNFTIKYNFKVFIFKNSHYYPEKNAAMFKKQCVKCYETKRKWIFRILF